MSAEDNGEQQAVKLEMVIRAMNNQLRTENIRLKNSHYQAGRQLLPPIQCAQTYPQISTQILGKTKISKTMAATLKCDEVLEMSVDRRVVLAIFMTFFSTAANLIGLSY